ncbi:MAG TPA: OmpA family protein [Acetobacteraceae bacterium]|nr:OmpA family protein [Acetobacteraceae bacterium]
MQLRGALLAAGLLALPIMASAQQPVTGPYVTIGIGGNIMQDENLKSFDGTATPGAKLDMGAGPVFVLGGGWGFGNGLRAEAEFDFRNNKVNSVSGCHFCGSISGTENKFGPMFNLAYDFNGLGPVVPYIGVGVGYQLVDDDLSTGGGSVTNTQGQFAYQAIVGLGVPIAAAPGLTVDAEYRFMGLAGSRDFTTSGGSASFRDQYNHAVLIGLRYNVGQAPAPAPAPMAAPAPMVQPARSYLVFFDWDKATLTDRARQIIHEAAENSTHVKVTRIEVNGYTDTSGTPQYNMGLSIRRADAVKAELIRDGVPAGEIMTQGFGETHLLVPTGPGVREPQNRRVEIILH